MCVCTCCMVRHHMRVHVLQGETHMRVHVLCVVGPEQRAQEDHPLGLIGEASYAW